MLCRKSRQEVEHVRQEPVSSHHFGRPLPLPSIPELGFQQFHTSSRPRRYCQKTQPPDSGKDFPKERLRHSHFRHLKYHVTGMADHFGSYFDELVPSVVEGPGDRSRDTECGILIDSSAAPCGLGSE